VPREAASRADVATCAVAPLAFLICNLISAIAHRSVRRHRRCGQHGCSRSRWTGSDVAHFEGARRAAGGFRIGLHFVAIRLLTVGARARALDRLRSHQHRVRIICAVRSNRPPVVPDTHAGNFGAKSTN
jgi:hypothetical protein